MSRSAEFVKKAAAAVLSAVMTMGVPSVLYAQEDQPFVGYVSAADDDSFDEIEESFDQPFDEESEESAPERRLQKEPSNAELENALAPYRARYKKGERQTLQMIGFFLSIGADRAAGIVAKGIADGHLTLDGKGSAALLASARDSLEVIAVCNDLRDQEGLPQLMADPDMMAIAMVQTSVSRSEIFHSHLYDVQESLAWGYNPLAPVKSGYSPFDVWYYSEKQISEAGGKDDEVRHYLHIVDPETTSTGAAIVRTPDALAGVATGQTFSTKLSGRVYLPDEMKAAINIFMNKGIGLNADQIVTSSESANEQEMFRLYNPNTGEHFYTASAGERNALVLAGWKFEGCGWIAPKKSDRPVYRLYNAIAGDHHYTTDKKERDGLVKVGWKDEGIGWYSASEKAVPVYRQYNPNARSGSHNFTPDQDEHKALGQAGWKLEGVAWYALHSGK